MDENIKLLCLLTSLHMNAHNVWWEKEIWNEVVTLSVVFKMIKRKKRIGNPLRVTELQFMPPNASHMHD